MTVLCSNHASLRTSWLKIQLCNSGRNGSCETAEGSESASSEQAGAKVAASSQAVNIINLLGGRANIVDVDACMTRLRCDY